MHTVEVSGLKRLEGQAVWQQAEEIPVVRRLIDDSQVPSWLQAQLLRQWGAASNVLPSA
ncbi:MAG: hypothetical protein MI924_02680 [Chloroflexales bacterium]|nr:hypothetical protein [Chloroflexales bacterium]